VTYGDLWVKCKSCGTEFKSGLIGITGMSTRFDGPSNLHECPECQVVHAYAPNEYRFVER